MFDQPHRLRSRRSRAAAAALLLLGAGACSDGDDASEVTTTTSIGTTTTVGTTTTTTTLAPTTTTAAPTTTAPETTTTTVAAGAELTMRANGLGTALFGADADGVIRYINSILGAPTTDSGWVDPTSTGGACPGTEVRFVSWGDLSLLFSDSSAVAEGARHFVSYLMGPPGDPAAAQPPGLVTAAGIGLGSTVAAVQAAYPGIVISPEDEISGPGFRVEDGLFGFTTGVGPDDVVIQLAGGFGCGE